MAANVPRWTGGIGLKLTWESGKLTIGERTLWVQVWEGSYAAAKAASFSIWRGYYGGALDGFGMLGWVVSSADLTSVRGARGKMTISWEPGGAYATMPLPADEVQIERLELYPRIEQHVLFNQTFAGISGGLPDITLATVALCYQAVHAPTSVDRDQAAQHVNTLSDVNQKTLGLILLDLLRKGCETYYLGGANYIWTYYSYMLPALSLGGFIQVPYGPGDAYLSVDPALSWLRVADQMEPAGVNGSMWKVRRSFLGAPKGHWDNRVYATF